MAKPPDETLRARLIEAAALEFAARGFQLATMDAVGAAAGVTKGGVYLHFPTKESLFFAALDECRAELRAELAATARPGADSAERLRALVSRWLGFHLRRPHVARLWRVLATEMQGRFTAELREDVRDEQRALRAAVRELLTQGGRDGSLFTEDPVVAAFLVAGTLLGVLDQWQASPDDTEVFGHAEDLAWSIVAPFTARGGGAGRAESAPI